MIFGVLEVEVGTPNLPKIGQKMKAKMGCLLASIFGGFWLVWGGKLGGKIEPRSIKNRSKIEAQDGLPLGIDFWWILVGFGKQVGLENRTKSEKKSIEKRIEK